MCRWLAYRGRPIYLDELLYLPDHSLIEQSLKAREAKTGTNGDGFGVGWYGERPWPGVYREVLPAWNDSNLRSLAGQIRASSFFAHVRASTGTATSRTNCHPFSVDKWMCMHNGQIGGYAAVRRRLENLLPDPLYQHRLGTTDSELIFLLMLAGGLEESPADAIMRTLAQVASAQRAVGVSEPFRFTASLTDGKTLYAVRYSTDAEPPTLYYAEDETALVVVSEPLDRGMRNWIAVPPDCLLIADDNGVCVTPIEIGRAVPAATDVRPQSSCGVAALS